MNVPLRLAGDISIAKLPTELDFKNAPSVGQQLLPIAKAGGKLLLDMSDVHLMSSAGVRVLLMLYRDSSSGARLGLMGVADNVREILEIAELLQRFQVYETVDEAISGLRSKG